jgi:uncharacterized membrane protein YjjP (DUF1212 family)
MIDKFNTIMHRLKHPKLMSFSTLALYAWLVCFDQFDNMKDLWVHVFTSFIVVLVTNPCFARVELCIFLKKIL